MVVKCYCDKKFKLNSPYNVTITFTSSLNFQPAKSIVGDALRKTTANCVNMMKHGKGTDVTLIWNIKQCNRRQ